ncbi:hypothetical protein GCM10022393_09110 [Aquimarina addita]|uniref:PKD domain-containing protein n=1 Tax=Aquimarina addita TaxID=870485 RepID=A0ABP7XCE2_9FLAO
MILSKLKIIAFISIVILALSCSNDDDEGRTTSIQITLSEFEDTITENASRGTVIGTLEVTVENSQETPFISITKQSVTDALALDGANIIINDPNAFDFEVTTEINWEVSATVGNTTETALFTVTIIDVPDGTANFSDLNVEINENEPQGTIIETLQFSLEGTNDIPTFEITDQSITDAVRLDGANLIINDANAFNFEVNTEITGSISATIADITDTADFTITIINLADAIITLEDFTTSISENEDQGTILGTLNATIEGSNETPIFIIENQSVADAVALDETNLIINDAAAFDYEKNTEITGQISMVVEGISTTSNFTITIEDRRDFDQTSIDPDNFVTTWETTADNESITIFTNLVLTYNYTIDWGDGTIETNQTGNATHTYAESGIYGISIGGIFPAINNAGDATNARKLKTIENWGNIVWESMNTAFQDCTNLSTIHAEDAPDLSRLTSTFRMFSGASLFSADLSNWDVSNITSFDWMFESATSFNGDISSWDVSNAISLSHMFDRAVTFNQDISSWDVSNVTNLSWTFYRARLFDQDLNSWNVSNVTDITRIFSDATSFNQDLDTWDTSNVTMAFFAFSGAESFNGTISTWDVSRIRSFSNFFANAHSFNKDISSWNVSSAIVMPSVFINASSFNQDISNWDVSNVTNMSSMFSGATSFNQNLGNWVTDNVTDCNNFANNSALTETNKPTAGSCAF